MNKLKIIIAMIIFGTIGLVRRYIPYSSAVVAFARGFIGVGFLLLINWKNIREFSPKKIKKQIIPLCTSGILLGANWILLFEAYRYTTVSIATTCYYMAPIIVILTSPIIFKERLTAKKGICALVAIVGMIFVSGIIGTMFYGFKGVLYGLGAAVLYALIVIINKVIDGISPSQRTIYQLGISAVALIPYIILTEDFSKFTFDIKAFGMLFVAGIVHTGIAYWLYFGSIKKVPAQSVAIFSYIDPILAVVLSVFVLSEAISPLAWIGVVLVIGAAMASEVSIKKQLDS